MYFFFDEKVDNNINTTNLEYIEIIGLFGRTNVKIKFDKEVNIFIGENGIGKTTILNCVYYILKKKYIQLAEIEFLSITVKFKNENLAHTVEMSDINSYNEKMMNHRRPYYNDEMIENTLQDVINEFDNSIIEYDIDILIRRVSDRIGLPLNIAKNMVYDYLHTERTKRKKKNGDINKIKELNNSIDNNIGQIVRYFTTYRRIENDFSNLINNEKRFHESDMLIRFGMSDVEASIKDILNLIGKNSIESFNKMTGVLLKQYASADLQTKPRNNVNQKINKEMLKIILDRLGNEIAKSDKNKILTLWDSEKIRDRKYSYLQDLIEKLVENYDKQKVHDDKIQRFAMTCNKYLNGKKFVYNQSELTLKVHLINNKFNYDNDDNDINIIPLSKLSSGEKQIVSLFSKLYLENEKDCILIIDEPELSISMKWQEMLIPDIMRSGNCKLLLTVTHSPFIFDNEFDSDAKELRACTKPFYKGAL